MPEEFLKEYLLRISEDVSKVQAMIEKDRERDQHFILFMEESKADRKALRDLVGNLQVKVDKLAELFGIHKKKGLWVLLVAIVTTALIGLGSWEKPKLLEKIFGLLEKVLMVVIK